MLIARDKISLQSALREIGPVTLVPTMGALHAGHLRLLAAAQGRGLKVAASIFVNPLQFGPSEDFSRYPRDEAGDLAKLAAAGCQLAWLPAVADMYAPGDATTITVTGPGLRWEGAARPGHFTGVATVVAKLFGQVRPVAAYFGEKDWQQVQVVRRMAADLSLPVEVVAVPTVREPDGLALSSRNRFLTPAERALAPVLYATLTDTASRILRSPNAADALADGAERLRAAGLKPDYYELVHAESLDPLPAFATPARLICAARLGSVRLLDNVAVG
jgi:pantoate--beta-alanine ligase